MFSDYVVLISAATGFVGTIAGATISYLSLRHTFKKDRYKLHVKLQESILAWPQPGTTKPKLEEGMLTYNLANVGHKDFTVVSLGLEIGRNSGGMFINDPTGTVKTPYVLKSGETCAFWGEFKTIKSKIDKPKLYNRIKVRAYVSDYLGNTFKSNWIKVTFKETKRDKFFNLVRKNIKKLILLIRP